MKKLKYITAVLLAGMLAVSCSKPYGDNLGVDNPEEWSVVYSAQALDDSLKRFVHMPMNSDTIFNVYANFGGILYPDTDIKVKFKIAEDLIAEYNEENATTYRMMLPESYSIGSYEVTIPKGELMSEPVSINMNSAEFDGVGTFLLPLQIESVSPSTRISDELRTAFIMVKGYYDENPFPIYDRSLWSIAGYSTQEPGEGSNRGGAATDAIDGDRYTYWCTAWRSTKPGPPHWIAVDMGERKELHGVVITGRAADNDLNTVRSTGNPRMLYIEVSDNNTDWENVGTFELINVLDNTLYLDHKVTTRYIKITTTATHGDTYGNNIAEINAF